VNCSYCALTFRRVDSGPCSGRKGCATFGGAPASGTGGLVGACSATSASRLWTSCGSPRFEGSAQWCPAPEAPIPLITRLNVAPRRGGRRLAGAPRVRRGGSADRGGDGADAGRVGHSPAQRRGRAGRSSGAGGGERDGPLGGLAPVVGAHQDDCGASPARGPVGQGLDAADGLLVVIDGAKARCRGGHGCFGANAAIHRCTTRTRPPGCVTPRGPRGGVAAQAPWASPAPWPRR
jgi:hypothetical protein